MQISIPEEVNTIIQKMVGANYEIYIVGGAVRDLLTNKFVTDWDFTTNATPQQIQQVFPNSFYGNKFGTVGVPTTSKELKPFEITTYRTEHGYSDLRRPDRVEWGKTLEEDLSRRDFTINAMALKDSTITDPFMGQKDLAKKIIRAVGDAHSRFSEDALRMLRAVRFSAQLGFTIETKTKEAIIQNASLINKIAKERVKDELFKILASQNPYLGFENLRATGLLVEILPELEKAFGVDQVSPQRHHIYDVGTHLMMALKNAKSTTIAHHEELFENMYSSFCQ